MIIFDLQIKIEEYCIMKKKSKQWWSTIPPITTKRTTTPLSWKHWT